MGKLKVPPCWILLGGAVLEIVGVTLLSQISTSPTIDGSQYGFQVIAGLGTGMVNAAILILVPYIVEKQDLGECSHQCLYWRRLTPVAVGTAANSQFRILGGLVGLAIVVSVSTPYVRSHLADILSPELVILVLQKTETIKELSADTALQVRTIFGDAYNLQIMIMIGFAAAKIPVTALMWTNLRSA